MKFAIVNDIKMEAERGLTGACLGCRQPMIPVCGVKKARHWRHKVDCECDRWWENETEWHRNWKNHFPKECQEIRHQDETTGEWHIADVKTKQDHVLEFQHSFLKPDERHSRNKFYRENLVWIVDGLVRKNDWPKLEAILKSATQIYQNIHLYQLPHSIDNSSLLTEWSDCGVPVFFDFGPDKPLCCLLPKSLNGRLYVIPFAQKDFIALHNDVPTQNGLNFTELMKTFGSLVSNFENPKPPMVPVIQKRIVIPHISQRDLNYLTRPPRRQFRRYRK